MVNLPYTMKIEQDISHLEEVARRGHLKPGLKVVLRKLHKHVRQTKGQKQTK